MRIVGVAFAASGLEKRCARPRTAACPPWRRPARIDTEDRPASAPRPSPAPARHPPADPSSNRRGQKPRRTRRVVRARSSARGSSTTAIARARLASPQSRPPAAVPATIRAAASARDRRLRAPRQVAVDQIRAAKIERQLEGRRTGRASRARARQWRQAPASRRAAGAPNLIAKSEGTSGKSFHAFDQAAAAAVRSPVFKKSATRTNSPSGDCAIAAFHGPRERQRSRVIALLHRRTRQRESGGRVRRIELEDAAEHPQRRLGSCPAACRPGRASDARRPGAARAGSPSGERARSRRAASAGRGSCRGRNRRRRASRDRRAPDAPADRLPRGGPAAPARPHSEVRRGRPCESSLLDRRRQSRDRSG